MHIFHHIRFFPRALYVSAIRKLLLSFFLKRNETMRHFLKPTFCTLYYHSGQSDNILPQPGFDPTILDNNDQN